jgi:predicted nucleic acid-binding Zn ribbon protein
MGQRSVVTWYEIGRGVPNEEAVAQLVRGCYESWPRATRSIVSSLHDHRTQYTTPRACVHCAATMPRPRISQRYCSSACKAKAERERSQLRKTAGIVRR